jgi:Type III restriction enzyme, res subunit
VPPKRKLPPFKKISHSVKITTPEEVFFSLTRAGSHGYLRGQQQDVLREYAAKGVNVPDVAFELPTGTGKTAVGLLLAESRRRAGEKVAYLCLNNQLAGQVLAEAAKLGIPVADLRGDKYSRDAADVGRFKTASAVGVSTYSNLFNINPVIKDCGLVVFDDAHGGEQYAAAMWTVTVEADQHAAQYSALVAALRPALSPAQFSEATEYNNVQIADIVGHSECHASVRAALDGDTEFQFQWQLMRPKLDSCVFLVSPSEVTIRPIIPPTHSHDAFASIGQRVYLSATLGGKSDLQRAYGAKQIELFRAKSAQWGRRYIFVPGLFTGDDQAFEIAAKIWDSLPVRRAVLIAPSGRAANKAYVRFVAHTTSAPKRLGSDDIKDDLTPFTTSTEVMLVLGGRYDGLDLPEDDCRLLLLVDSPAATNALERHLTSKWKMGPVMRRKERTRLIQGMGRCTRSATDFAVVLWLGQSLVDIASAKSAISNMPIELQRELGWGIEQVKESPEMAETLVEMASGLVGDRNYRKQANDGIAEAPAVPPKSDDDDKAGIEEVKFSIAMWEGDFEFAYQTARAIADKANSPELAGYRGWWWYLASVAARLAGNNSGEIDALWHSQKSGVHIGFATHLLSERKAKKSSSPGFTIPINVERIWDTVTDWGWAGPAFDKKLDLMLSLVKQDEASKFHQGLEMLGRCVGSLPLRPTTDGAPDVVWSFGDLLCVCFEAKTEKKPSGAIFKKDLEEAKLHPDWVKHNTKISSECKLLVVLVSQTAKLDKVAEPFAEGIFYLEPNKIRSLADHVVTILRSLRAKFAGRDYADAEKEFAAEISAAKLDFESLKSTLASAPLKKQKK